MLPTRISVCTAPGRSMTTSRRVACGGAGAVGASDPARPQPPNARSAPANASSALTSPTMARMALLAPNHFLWNPSRSSRRIARDRRWCPGLRLAVRMKSIDQPVEHHVGQVLRIVVTDLQPGQDLLTLALDFLARKGRMLREIRDQVEADVQAVLHHHGLNEAEVGAGAGAERTADGINRVGDLLGRPGRRALIEQRRRQRRHAGTILGVLRRTGAHDQAEADRRLLVMRNRDHFEPVGKSTDGVGRKLDVVRLERTRRSFRRPVPGLRRPPIRQPAGARRARTAARDVTGPPAVARRPWA